MAFWKSQKFPRDMPDTASYLHFNTALKKHKKSISLQRDYMGKVCFPLF